jgi:hypothetical protein
VSTRAYRVRVHDAGTTTPVDGTVDFTLDTQLAAAPNVPGQTIDPIRGRTRSRPWSVEVIDASGVLTSRLGDAGGRMQVLGKLWELQENVDSAGWETLTVGRLAQLSESSGPGLYQAQIEDERWVERNARIFTGSDTSQVYPIGFRYPWREFPAAPTQRMTVSAVRDNLVLLEVELMADAGGPMLPEVGELIEADLKPETTLRTTTSAGNFQTLRANVSGTSREVVAFGYTMNAADQFVPQLSLGWANGLTSENPVGALWVVWPTSQPSVGASVTVSLSMPAHEPNEFLPLHLGVTDAGHDYGTAGGGIHPFDLVERLYIEAGVRYDSAAIDALIADNTYPPGYWRITEAANLAEWLEDNIFGPLCVVPFINALGEVSPKSVALPVDVDPDTLPVLTASNIGDHPTFLHTRRELVNRIVFKAENLTSVPSAYLTENAPRPGADGLRAFAYEFTRDHDNTASLGVSSIEVRVLGFHGGIGGLGFAGDSVATTPRDRVADFLAREIYHRFGDGPITGRVSGLSAIADVEPGDFVLMDLATYPNPADNARGSERILQILQKDLTPYGPEFEYLDAGPYLQPLAEPAVSIAQNAARPTNDVDVTLSSVPAGATATVQLAYNATEPAAGSPLWFVARSGLPNGTVTIPDNPTGAHVWARARAEAPGRIRSGWSAADDVTLTGGAYIRNLGIVFDTYGTPTVYWEPSADTAGVKIFYVKHGSAIPTGTLIEFGDADADDLSLEMTGVTVARGQWITIEVEPWTGFSAGAVTGDEGPRERITEQRIFQLVPVDPHLYGFTKWEEVETGDPSIRQFEYETGDNVHSVWGAILTYDYPLVVNAEADIKGRVTDTGALSGTITLNAVGADKAVMYRYEARYENAEGGLSIYGPDSVEQGLWYAEPAKINGVIDAKYDAGVLKVFAFADPTASALPVAYEIRADSKTGSVLASGSWTSIAAAQAGVGGSGALTNLTPPADGKKLWYAKFTDVAGNIEWHSDSVENPVKPRIRKLRQVVGSSNVTTDIYVTVESPLGRDITLKVWTNKAGTANGDPAGATDADIAVGFTAGTPGSTEVGPSNASLDNVPVWPGRGKKVYFEAVDDLGFSTGVIDYTLMSWLDIIGSNGLLTDSAIDRPAAFAASIRPLEAMATRPANGDYVGHRIAALDTGLAWEWTALATWEPLEMGAGGFYYYPFLVADSVTAREVAAKELTGAHLNIADVYVTGLTTTNNSPGAGSIAWSACTVDHLDDTYAVAGGNTSAEVVWWSPVAGSGTTFQTSSASGLEAAGYDQNRGDRIILLNQNGTARQVWNGTRIYGGHLTNEAIDTRHLVAQLVIVGKTIESDNFAAGSAGWRLEDDVAEFNDVTVRGTLDGVDGDFDTLTVGTWLRSGNYSAGTAGFSLESDGSAEFNQVTIRGVIIVDSDDGNVIQLEYGGATVGALNTTASGLDLQAGSSVLQLDGNAALVSDGDVTVASTGGGDIILSGGKVLAPGLPTSSAGLASGQFWRDAANANVVKQVP